MTRSTASVRWLAPLALAAVSTSIASSAAAFCDDLLATQVLCTNLDPDEIKLCASVDPASEADILALHVTRGDGTGIADGPLEAESHLVPFDMIPGTGSYPWDSYSLTFQHEAGRAVLDIKRTMSGPDAMTTEISLSLFEKGVAPAETLTCSVPAIVAEVDNLMILRGIDLNADRALYRAI